MPSVTTTRQAVRRLLAGSAKDSQLKARAEALERLRDDIAVFVRWPALQASLDADAAALRAAIRAPAGVAPHAELEQLILTSIADDGTTAGAWAQVRAQAGERSWRKVLDASTQRLRIRGLIRYEGTRWVLAA